MFTLTVKYTIKSSQRLTLLVIALAFLARRVVVVLSVFAGVCGGLGAELGQRGLHEGVVGVGAAQQGGSEGGV